jgi:hypothetical protein
MNIKLVDSSEFHGSPEREWKYKLFKIKSTLSTFMTPKALKYALYFILWFIAGRVTYS